MRDRVKLYLFTLAERLVARVRHRVDRRLKRIELHLFARREAANPEARAWAEQVRRQPPPAG